jgi:hypothetical protein
MAKSLSVLATLTAAPAAGEGYAFLQPDDGSPSIYVPRGIVAAHKLSLADIGKHFDVAFYERATDGRRVASTLALALDDVELDEFDRDIRARLSRIEGLLSLLVSRTTPAPSTETEVAS